MGVERVGVGIVDLVLAHVVLLELHVLNCALCRQPHINVTLKARQLVIQILKLAHFILQYPYQLVAYSEVYVHLLSSAGHDDPVLEEELQQVEVLDELEHRGVAHFVVVEELLVLGLYLLGDEEELPGFVWLVSGEVSLRSLHHLEESSDSSVITTCRSSRSGLTTQTDLFNHFHCNVSAWGLLAVELDNELFGKLVIEFLLPLEFLPGQSLSQPQLIYELHKCLPALDFYLCNKLLISQVEHVENGIEECCVVLLQDRDWELFEDKLEGYEHGYFVG